MRKAGSDAEERQRLEVVMRDTIRNQRETSVMRCWNTRQKTTPVCRRLDKRIKLTTKQSSSLSGSEGHVNESSEAHINESKRRGTRVPTSLRTHQRAVARL